MKIGKREVGPDHPCLIVAEVGLAHDGSENQAHAYIDAVADAGVDAVKFQAHYTCERQEWRVKPPWWCRDPDRSAFWNRTSFPESGWAALSRHADERGLTFLCSPFSIAAVEVLSAYVPAWKIASGQVTNTEMLKVAATTGKPAILSDGLATETEMVSARARFKESMVLACTTAYPTPAAWSPLPKMQKYDRPRGLSDHSGTIYPALAATALGCDLIEVHVTWDRRAFGFDASSSLTIDELAKLVEGVRHIEACQWGLMSADPEFSKNIETMRGIFMAKETQHA